MVRVIKKQILKYFWNYLLKQSWWETNGNVGDVYIYVQYLAIIGNLEKSGTKVQFIIKSVEYEQWKEWANLSAKMKWLIYPVMAADLPPCHNSLISFSYQAVTCNKKSWVLPLLMVVSCDWSNGTGHRSSNSSSNAGHVLLMLKHTIDLSGQWEMN